MSALLADLGLKVTFEGTVRHLSEVLAVAQERGAVYVKRRDLPPGMPFVGVVMPHEKLTAAGSFSGERIMPVNGPHEWSFVGDFTV